MTTVAATDTSKLVQAQFRLMEIAWGFMTSQAFMSAHDLGVFDALTQTPAA